MGGMSNAWDHGVRYRGTYEMGRQLTWAWKQLHDDAPAPWIAKLLETEKKGKDSPRRTQSPQR